jgi:hypothetical protein
MPLNRYKLTQIKKTINNSLLTNLQTMPLNHYKLTPIKKIINNSLPTNLQTMPLNRYKLTPIKKTINNSQITLLKLKSMHSASSKINNDKLSMSPVVTFMDHNYNNADWVPSGHPTLHHVEKQNFPKLCKGRDHHPPTMSKSHPTHLLFVSNAIHVINATKTIEFTLDRLFQQPKRPLTSGHDKTNITN